MTNVWAMVLMVVVVTICGVCAIGILTRLILDEIDRYKMRREARAAKIMTDFIKSFTKHGLELVHEAQKTVVGKQSSDEYFDKIEEWAKEAQKDEE